jgi:hypothetical protein
LIAHIPGGSIRIVGVWKETGYVSAFRAGGEMTPADWDRVFFKEPLPLWTEHRGVE